MKYLRTIYTFSHKETLRLTVIKSTWRTKPIWCILIGKSVLFSDKILIFSVFVSCLIRKGQSLSSTLTNKAKGNTYYTQKKFRITYNNYNLLTYDLKPPQLFLTRKKLCETDSISGHAKAHVQISRMI